MPAGITAQNQRTGPALGKVKPNCSAIAQHRDDLNREPFHPQPTTACTVAQHQRTALGLGIAKRERSMMPRRRHNDLGLYKVEPDCLAKLRHRDDEDQAPFLLSPSSVCTVAPLPHSDLV